MDSTMQMSSFDGNIIDCDNIFIDQRKWPMSLLLLNVYVIVSFLLCFEIVMVV